MSPYELGRYDGMMSRERFYSFETDDDEEATQYLKGYLKGVDLYQGEIMMHNQTVRRYSDK